MRLALSRAIGPLAGVALLPAADVIVVDVLDESVHVAQVADVAPFPSAHGHLVISQSTVVVVLAAADESQRAGGVGKFARGVRGDGGGG